MSYNYNHGIQDYNDRPRLQASRQRFNQARRHQYNDYYSNNNNNYYNKYDFNGPRQGVKRPNDRQNHTNTKRYRPHEAPEKASSLNDIKILTGSENKTDNKSQPCKSTNIESSKKIDAVNAKNIASNRMVQLRKSLELKKPDNISNQSNIVSKESNTNQTKEKVESNNKDVFIQTKEKVESNQKDIFIVNNKTPQRSASDRLKNIRNSASKSAATKTQTDLIKSVNEKSLNISQLISKPKTLADRLKVNNNSNATLSKNLEATVSEKPSPALNIPMETECMASPMRLEKKIDKIGFTNDWIANTNFDGDTSSFMEISTQARANDTVANLDTVNCDMAEMEWTSEISAKKMFKGKDTKSHDVCIVVDTNIFIHNLGIIKDILKIKTSGATIPIVYIPWMVITELDFIKDSSHDIKLKKTALIAVKYINEILSKKNPRLICQTVFEVDKQREMGKSPDDKIMSCCLQALETYEYVFLFSNDINLKNKAMIHNIPALSANEVIIRIMAKLNKAVKVQAVMSKMGMLLSYIVVESVKECYGPIWSKMDMLSEDQPWPFQKCLKIFKRYWATVFKDKFLKHAMKGIDDTLTFITKLTHICDDSEEYIKLVKHCVTLCVFLKDSREHTQMIEKTIKDITNI